MTHGSLKKNSSNQNPSTGSGYFRLFRETLKRYLQRVPAIRETGATVSRRPSGQAETVRCIAFYLPQFHRIPENDAWWGEGFTEWTHVKKAAPLFEGHLQPKIPSTLGYYDLTDPGTREAQAQLARDAGIEGFCYWHYWFGNGNQLLERPFTEVMESGRPDFPFCLAWANESWTGRWHGLDDKILIRQEYPGRDDYAAHFLKLERAFNDKRYIRVNGNLLFVVYKPWEIPNPAEFTRCWRELSMEKGLRGFYFIGISDTPLPAEFGFDGYMRGTPLIPERTIFPTFAEILVHRIFNCHLRRRVQAGNPGGPEVYTYKSLVRHSLNDPLGKGEFPVVIPNWDNTPRVGRRGIVLQGSTPELFSFFLEKAVSEIRSRPAGEQIIFIKSWNEWAEGNYLEPDWLWGKGYLDAITGVMGRER